MTDTSELSGRQVRLLAFCRQIEDNMAGMQQEERDFLLFYIQLKNSKFKDEEGTEEIQQGD